MNDFKKDIDKLYDHAKIANEEMGEIREHLSVAQNDITWIKERILSIDGKIWLLISSIVVGIIIQIIIKFIQ